MVRTANHSDCNVILRVLSRKLSIDKLGLEDSRLLWESHQGTQRKVKIQDRDNKKVIE